MHTRRDKARLALALGLALLVGVAGCGGSTAHTTASPTTGAARPTASARASSPTSAATPGVVRLAYPWQMVEAPGNTPPYTYLPDTSVRDQVSGEQATDLRVFWTWIGYLKPGTIVHFQPDPAQVSRLTYGAYVQTVQQALNDLKSTGRLITYAASDFTLGLEGCTQDGLTCKALLSLGLARKVVYDTSTGQEVSEDPPSGQAPTYGVASLTLHYSQEKQQWQIAALKFAFAP